MLTSHLRLHRHALSDTAAPYLSIVIPAYNESSRIASRIEAIIQYLASVTYRWEIIVVDDGSTDTTADVVMGFALPQMRLLRLEQNRGKGYAVRAGVQASTGYYVLFTDADNSTPITEIEQLFAHMRSHDAQIVIGSRRTPGATVAGRSLLRSAMSFGLQMLVQDLLDLRVADTQCGFKLFTRACAQQLFGLQRLHGFAFDLEILYIARQYGYGLAEVSVNWSDTPGSKVRPFRDTGLFIRDLLTIRRNALRGMYAEAPTSHSISMPL